MDATVAVVTGIWAMLPAYVPNNVAVLAGGGPPIDGGRTVRGSRLLGDGKTWRGTVAGILAGVILALLLNAVRAGVTGAIGVSLPTFSIASMLSLPTGALLGDILASFVKRRIGRQRGSAVPLLDQLDFVAIALLLTLLADPGWFQDVFTLPVLGVVLVLTPLLHVGTNAIAYWLGLKNEPW
ncbi:MAG: CDP-2,3-bis-(O-geranylgeranyl)-sn-glycerol synthase [Halodesulfurarchaeum sp.]